MSASISRTRDKVMADQQAMIRWLETRGVHRKMTASAIGVAPNTLDHVMSDSPYRLSTEAHEALVRLAFERGYRDYVEHSLPEGYMVVPIPDIATDGSTDDEVLDGAEYVGRIRQDALRGRWEEIEEYGYMLVTVGYRTSFEARRQLGRPAAPLHALPAPLFDHITGDGSSVPVAIAR